MTPDVYSDLLLGLNAYAGVTKVLMRGYNPTASTGTETVAGFSSAYVVLTAGAAMEVVSSSASDTAAGTGARTVRVTGVLGTTYLPFTEDISLNGTTPVPLVNTTAVAINSLKVLTAGSGLRNAGTINCRVVSGGAIKRTIGTPSGSLLGASQDQDFLYTIPAGYVGLLKTISVSAYSNTGAALVSLQTVDTTGLRTDQGVGLMDACATGFSQSKCTVEFGSGLIVPEKTCIDLICSMTATPLVTAQADLYLINQSQLPVGTRLGIV